MASTIKLKNGSGAPTTGDLVQGEPALDLTNKRLYTENASGVVIEVGVNPTSITTGNITANGTINLTGATVSNAGSITTADINGGTIDGTVIGGSSAAAGSFTTISASGEIAANGGVALGDNDKATFGDSDDLQIYHDGSNSYVTDAGTGDLRLSANNLRMQNADNTANYIKANNGSNVELYFSNAAKLATTATGIDVTGTVTADGLTVSGSGAVGSFDRTDANAIIELKRSGSVQGYIGASTGGDIILYNASAAQKLRAADNGDISFYEDTGTSPKMVWKSADEQLGIGTDSPSAKLTLNDAGQQVGIDFKEAGTTRAHIEYDGAIPALELGTNGASNVVLKTSNTERVRISSAGACEWRPNGTTQAMTLDSSGNLLVGTTSAAAKLTVEQGSANTNGANITNQSFDYQTLGLHNTATSGDNLLVSFVTDASSFRGSISFNRAGGLIAYNTTSDYRAKDIIGPVTDSGSVIDSTPVYMGKMKGATQERPMFIAHETPAYAHTGEKDAVDKDGNPVYQQIDASALVPVMWAEIQSLRARVAQLEGAN